MLGRISHRNLLIVIAVCNLVLWVAVAAAVGLVVSDKVDLGVETLIRERQATVVVIWEQAVARTSKATAIPTVLATDPTPVKTRVARAGITREALVRTPAATAPSAAITAPRPRTMPSPTRPVRPNRDQTSRAVPTPSPTRPIGPTQDQPSRTTPKPSPTPRQPTPLPTETPVRSPLLMSEPTFNNLTRMGQEMNRSAEGRPVQIRYSEAMLNHEIQTWVQKDESLPYRNVHADLKRGGAVVTADVTVLGFEVDVEIVGTVEVRDCRPHMEIQSISMAGVLTPGFVKDRAKETLLEALNWYPADYPLCLQQIVLEEERVTVYGYRR